MPEVFVRLKREVSATPEASLRPQPPPCPFIKRTQVMPISRVGIEVVPLFDGALGQEEDTTPRVSQEHDADIRPSAAR